MKKQLFYLKNYFIICILILVVSCKKCNCFKDKNKNINTYIFDFDNTIVPDSAIGEAIFMATNENINKQNIINKIMHDKETQLKSQKPFVHLVMPQINKIIGRKINKNDMLATSYKIYEEQIPNEMKKIIKRIKRNHNEVFIIGGGYSTCTILLNVAKLLNLNIDNVYSGAESFDENGNYYYNIKNEGFVQCSTGKKIENNWTKSSVIKYLKENNKIVGKITHIGDGTNDLEVWKSKEVDLFIGFGIYKIRDKVLAEAPIFVKTFDSLKNIIYKDINDK